MRFGTKAIFLCVVVALGATAQAARCVIKNLANDWTLANSYEGGVAPVAGDEVVIPKGSLAKLSAPSASFNLVNTLSRITPGENAQLEISVTSGEQTLDTPFTDYTADADEELGVVRGGQNGVLVKKGAGSLVLGVTDTRLQEGSTSYAFMVSMSVEAGVLKLPQNAPNMNYSICKVNVAKGATFYTMATTSTLTSYGVTSVSGLSGLGTVTNVSSASAIPRRLAVRESCTFDGIIGGGIVMTTPTAGVGITVNLTNPSSTYSAADYAIAMEGKGSRFGMQKLWAGANTKSSMGSTEFFRGYVADTGVIYLGKGGETTKMGINVSNSPFTIDAGAYGGLTFEHGHEWRGSYGNAYTQSSMQYIYLDGSNTQKCVFRPRLLWWVDSMPAVPAASKTNAHWHITKKGTGTWKFERNPSAEWRGGLAVENGTLEFDTLLETNKNCSLGYGTHAQVRYQGFWNPGSNTPYQVKIGDGGEHLPVLDYVGSNFIHVTTRHLGIDGRGCLKNSGYDVRRDLYTSNGVVYDNQRKYGPRRFYLKGVMGAGKGDNELVLDGKYECRSQVDDLEDGEGTLSVTKVGSGDWVLGGELTLSGRVKAEEGTLYVHDGKHYNWFKWTIKQTHWYELSSYQTYAMQTSEFALYDQGGNRVNVGMTAPDFNSKAPDGKSWWVSDPNGDGSTDYTSLAYNSAAVGRPTLAQEYNSVDYEIGHDNIASLTIMNKGFADIFDDLPATANSQVLGVFSRSKMEVSNTKRYVSLYLHAKPKVKVASYDWAMWQGKQGWIPTYWTLEGSVNGIDWVELDVRNSVMPLKDTTADFNYWSCPSASGQPEQVVSGQVRSGYQISEGPWEGPKVLQNATIAAGAAGRLVADGDITVSRLEVDAEDAGTIEGFTFAENGSLNVTNLPLDKQVTLPGKYVDVDGLKNLINWQLLVNGKPSKKRISIANDQITILSGGIMVIYR